MADPVTTNKGLTVPATGSDPNTWGGILNANFDLIDAFLGSTGALTISSGTVVLSSAQVQNLRISLAGTLTGNVTIQITQKAGYFYFHDLTTRGGYSITVTTGASGSRTQNLPSKLSHVFTDGSGVYLVTEPNHGESRDFAGSTPPPLWLLADGSAVSRTVYADLFAAVGTTWGSGDGSTTFNLPDFRGRSTFGADAMGGTAANRLTTASIGTAAVVGVGGGHELLQSHNHSTTENPHNHSQNAHNHGINNPAHSHSAGDSGHGHSDAGHSHSYTSSTSSSFHVAGAASGATVGIQTTSTGSGNANIQTGYANVYVNATTTSISANAATATNNPTVTGLTVNSNGSGSAQNVPPAAVVNKIIYAGQ